MAQTLPREIIKWIQGLDLSYSVKDYRKDLSNGFLIAEILSRYYPGQIQMHSFDNSQNKERRQNNWSLLDKFFQKQAIPLGRDDFAKILSSNDAATIIDFMVKLYEELTSKKINRNPIAVIQNFNKTLGATGKQEDFNQSFLLKDKGLEKFPEDRQGKDIEERKPVDREENKLKDEKDHKEPHKLPQHYEMSKSSQITTSSKLKTFLKYESRLISPRPELSTLKFEVKSTNIRPLNINVSKLRATKENNLTMGGTSNYTHMSMEMGGAGNVERPPPSPHQGAQALMATDKSQNSKKEKQKEQTIYDILGELMDVRFANSSFAKEYQQFNLKSYPEAIPSFNDYFNAMVFKEILERIEFITSFVLRDLNETWKLVNFMLNCLKSVLIDKEYFRTIIEILRHLGERTVNKDPHRSLKLLKENFLETIYAQLVTAPIFEKKEHIAMLMYYFIPNTADAKRQIILAFKDVAKDQKIFMEALVILISSEKNNKPGEDVSFYFEIGMKYAKAGIQSSHPVVKTMSLALIANLARLNYDLIFEFIRSRLDDLSLEEGWEDKCQVIIICSKIVNGLINTDNYQNLVKKNTLNYTKNYSWQNEMIANKLKEDIKTFGDAIIKILQSKPNNYVVRVFIVYCVDICHEVKGIMDQIVSILVQSNKQFRNWFFHNKEDPREEFFVYNDKSLRYRTGFNSEELKKSSKEFLMSLTENVRESRPERLESSHLEILEFGLSHTDFKVLNVELLLGITNLFIPYTFTALCDEELLEIATRVLKIFLTYRIEQDLRIKDLEKLFGDTLVYLYRSESEICLNNMKDVIGWYREEIDARKLFRENELFKEMLQYALGQDVEKQYLEELQKFMESIISSLEMEKDIEK